MSAAVQLAGLQEAVDVAFELGIDDTELAARKRFLDLGEADAEQLARLSGRLVDAQNGFAEGFYAYLRQLPELSALLPDDETVGRLRAAHGRYFAALIEGRYDEAYIANRLRVGMTHARIGLTPKWYVGAFRKYLSDMLRAVWRAANEDIEQFLPAFDALLKVVMLDIGLTLDTYIHIDKRAIALRDQAIESASNGIFIAGAAGPEYPLIYANEAFSSILRCNRTQADNGSYSCHEDDNLSFIRAAIDECRHGYASLSRALPDGARQWLDLYLAPVHDNSGRVSHFVGILNDVSKSKDAEERVTYLTNHDPLTGLANRTAFETRLRQAVEHTGSSQCLALYLINLDRFALINDSFGYDVGDVVLSEVASRLNDVAGHDDAVARLGADEFVILAGCIENAEAAGQLSTRIEGALSRPLLQGGREIDLSAGIGIAIYPGDGREPDTLLRNANAALGHAKTVGRGAIHFYDESMNRQAAERLMLESDLRRALNRSQLVLYYQPQVHAGDGSLAGVEALLRWRHPERGLVPPDEFIPLAEESGLIAELGEWVLAEVVRQAIDWQARGIGVPRIAVNLSPRQFSDPQLVDRIQQLITSSGVAADVLELEITESAAMRNPHGAAEALHQLRRCGVRLALDDFGTGHSSLAILRTLPLDVLKLDRSFIRNLPEAETDARVAEAVIDLARRLRLSVVAEGVETVEQQSFLADAGCQVLQGFLFSRPVPANELEIWLAGERPVKGHSEMAGSPGR